MFLMRHLEFVDYHHRHFPIVAKKSVAVLVLIGFANRYWDRSTSFYNLAYHWVNDWALGLLLDRARDQTEIHSLVWSHYAHRINPEYLKMFVILANRHHLGRFV